NLVPQGISAELLAADWDLSREELDDFGYRSHSLAGQATAEGRFRKEIFPVKIEGDHGSELFETDQGIRYPSDRAKMASLLSPFFNEEFAKQFPEIRWVVTAGNSAQITDGAAALLIMSREKAEALGLRPRARFHSFALAGGDPVRMLAGPIPATRKALERGGLDLQADIDVVEINEAFASVVLGWKKVLGVDDAWFEERVNPNGGAIALGHPLGASGARLMTTLLHELERRAVRRGGIARRRVLPPGGQASPTRSRAHGRPPGAPSGVCVRQVRARAGGAEGGEGAGAEALRRDDDPRAAARGGRRLTRCHCVSATASPRRRRWR